MPIPLLIAGAAKLIGGKLLAGGAAKGLLGGLFKKLGGGLLKNLGSKLFGKLGGLLKNLNPMKMAAKLAQVAKTASSQQLMANISPQMPGANNMLQLVSSFMR